MCWCLCVGGCASDSSVKPLAPSPLQPLSTPAGVTQSVQVVAGLLPLGTVPYDNMVLPLLSPDGSMIAVQTGAPPTWASLLARPNADIPSATRVAIYQLDLRLGIDQANRKAPALIGTLNEPLLLGRSCDAQGFLVESIRSDGSRWIGKVAWPPARNVETPKRPGGGAGTGLETSTSGRFDISITWLVSGSEGEVNAFAALGPNGQLAWSRRSRDSRHFDLIVRDQTSEWMIRSSEGNDWLFPVWPHAGEGLFVLSLKDHNLDICHGIASSDRAFMQSMQWLGLVNDATDATAYQVLSAATGACDIPASVRDQLVYYHPGGNRMALWRPLGVPGRKTALMYSGSVAALVDQESFAFSATMENLYRQNLANPRQFIALVPGSHVPRATTSSNWPFMLLTPAAGQVGVVALRLLPKESSVLTSRDG
jgi:hypothetical protein